MDVIFELVIFVNPVNVVVVAYPDNLAVQRLFVTRLGIKLLNLVTSVTTLFKVTFIVERLVFTFPSCISMYDLL